MMLEVYINDIQICTLAGAFKDFLFETRSLGK